jgi:2',3'-cyclic-nucleotide 2'-phosphodiesterase (5'-nucleotidase family)
MVRPMKRSLAAVLLAAFFVSIVPARDAVRSITILHTNDLHAHLLPSEAGRGGFARLATAIREERRNCDSCLVLNAGDLVQGSPVSTIFHGVPVFELSNLFGFDAAVLGNHEFDYGWETVKKFLEVARYPIVTANVVDSHGRLMAKKPYVILETNGVRVAVLGALTDEMAKLEKPKLMGEWRVLPVVESLRPYVAEVRNRSDLIVVLAHVTPREEEAILRSFPEVQAAITGHLHSGLTDAVQVEGRVVVRVRGYGEELGRLDLQVSVPNKKVVAWNWKRIPIDGRFAAAPDMDKEVRRWEGEVTKLVDLPIGESRARFTRDELKRLIEQAMTEAMHADFALINNGSLRADLPQGPLLARHIWNIMPFDNIVVLARIQGKDLPRVVAAEHTIDPNRFYTLASTDFTAATQGPGELGKRGIVFTADGPPLRDLLIAWIQKQKVVAPPETSARTARPLFDGKTLDGWEVCNGTAKYTVENGMIVGTTSEGSPNSFLCTQKEYGDFVLEFDENNDPVMNSGVQIRSHRYPEDKTVTIFDGSRNVQRKQPKGRVYGYQVEIATEKSGNSGGIYDEARRGWVSSIAADPVASKAFKDNQWNHYRVAAMGDSIRTWVNGVPCADLVDPLDQTGFIALQVHQFKGDKPAQVRFRNIQIQDLGRHVWKPIWDGRTLSGWTPSGGAEWKLEDGAIHATSLPNDARIGYLVNAESFRNVTARLRYKMIKGNSGFFLRADPKTLAGYEMEIDEAKRTGGVWESGGRKWMTGPEDNAAVRAGEWNELTASLHDHRIVFHVNGSKTVDLPNDTQGRMEGHIALQAHGSRRETEIWFRDIEVLTPER